MFDFGQRISKLRKARGLSQKDLAQKVGISKSSLGNYENDMGIPSLLVAEDLASVLNVSLDYLVYGEKTRIITAKMLKDEQIQLLTELVQEISMPSGQGHKLSSKQQDLLARIIEQFLR